MDDYLRTFMSRAEVFQFILAQRSIGLITEWKLEDHLYAKNWLDEKIDLSLLGCDQSDIFGIDSALQSQGLEGMIAYITSGEYSIDEFFLRETAGLRILRKVYPRLSDIKPSEADYLMVKNWMERDVSPVDAVRIESWARAFHPTFRSGDNMWRYFSRFVSFLERRFGELLLGIYLQRLFLFDFFVHDCTKIMRIQLDHLSEDRQRQLELAFRESKTVEEWVKKTSWALQEIRFSPEIFTSALRKRASRFKKRRKRPTRYIWPGSKVKVEKGTEAIICTWFLNLVHLQSLKTPDPLPYMRPATNSVIAY